MMKKLIVNAVVGIVLFGGSLVGALAATGRLNHDGVANIPVLSSLFPPPPEGDAEGGDGEAHGAEEGETATVEADAHAAPAGEAAPASFTGGEAGVADAAHSVGGAVQEPQGPRRVVKGKSVLNPEPEPAAEGHGGGGHGGDEGGHGEEEKHGEEAAAEHATHGTSRAPAHPKKASGEDVVERDFTLREMALAQEQANRYSPGGYFVFDGMPSGMTPEQLNAAWERVQGVLADLEKRRVALDLREKGLQVREDDLARRQLEIAKLREEIRSEHRRLDDRIAKFKEQVILVRNDEVAALKRNAEILASFEASKSAELITEQWGTEEGQAEVLKMFEFMDDAKVSEIINELSNPLIQEVLKKRLRVSREAVPSESGR